MSNPVVIRVDNLEKVVQAVWLHADQARYAAAEALNRTAEEVNATLRLEIPRRFTIREQALLRHLAPRQLPRHQRATKENLAATLMTAELSAILGPYEEGEPHVRGTRPVIVPTTSLRPTKASRIGRQFYPTNLGLQPRRDPSGRSYYALGRGAIAKKLTPFKQGNRGWTITGKLGTFALDPQYHPTLSKGQAGVYQRVGGKLRKLWHYVDRVRRPKSLQFQQTADRIMDTRFGPNFDGVLDVVLRKDRGWGTA